MQVRHVLSRELLFVYSDSGNNTLVGEVQLVPTTLYNCRRFVEGTGYLTVQLYGAELQTL